jgi:hypothetical protein
VPTTRPSPGQARRPDDPPRGAAAVATAPARLVGELLIALPYVVGQLPPLVQDARVLVGELTRLARGTDTGALNDVVKELARLASEDGELTALAGETARLAGAKAEDGPSINGGRSARRSPARA